MIISKSEFVLLICRDMATLKHFGKWAIEACYDLQIRYGYNCIECSKSEIVDAVIVTLKNTGMYV